MQEKTAPETDEKIKTFKE